LTNLNSLDLHSNQISEISFLTKLTNLKTLHLTDNPFDDLSPLLPLIRQGLPVEWAEYEYSEAIYLYNNPLIIPPIEFAQAGSEAILEYFDQLGEDRSPLNELKVIFLGEGAAGKTSLIKQVRAEDFDPQESQTHGIRIQLTPFKVDGDTIQAHVWDFGGQEVMHATHQFFLSRRCVYVLVLNSRTDEKAEYWLKHASSFGGNSPVLVVLNKMDENPSYEIDRKQLREKYPQIIDFFKVSCQTGAGIDAFKAALLDQVSASDTRRTPFPKAWAAVKAHFTQMDADYINDAEYRQVCEAQGVTRALSQGILLEFLHDLGVVINFKNLRHFDTQILNPLWLTNGVYRIINSPIVAAQSGIMREDELDRIINDPRYAPTDPNERTFHYPSAKLAYIARVMEAFELCFHLDADTYVVPQLLPVAEPDFEMKGTMLHFVLHFPEFLPDSVFPRLMVKLHPYISGSLRWRTGMVLHKPSIFDAQARIRVDREDRKIKIDLCGASPRRLLSFIRETVREIVDGFAHLNYDELVPVPGTTEIMEYNYLLEAEKAGEKTIFIRGKGSVSIEDLLNGVEEAAMREEAAQIPVRVFLSYSQHDDAYRQALRTALAPLIRLNKLQIWDDRDITAGDEWKEQIFRELAAADLVLCLISADFIASDFCYSEELARALNAHSLGEQVVVPVRTRQCAWDGLPIAQLQGVPTSGWLSSAPNLDEALTQVANHLSPLVEQIKAKKLSRQKDRPGITL